MRRILSAEMYRISKSSIKKMVKNGSRRDVIVSDKAAGAIAAMLERKAKLIAEYAVKRAKSRNRGTITEEDIDTYRLKFGD